MKRLKPMLLAFAFLLLGTHTASACTCVVDSLGKRLNKAKAVFVGRAVADEPQESSSIQNFSNKSKHSQTVEVVKSFKGVKKRFINITFDVASLKPGGSCPILYYLEPNYEYLVFAYGEKYEAQTVCSDTWEVPDDKDSLGYEQMQSYLKKLDRFWFRLRAKLNPF